MLTDHLGRRDLRDRRTELRFHVEALQATIIWLGDGSNAGLGVGYNQIMQTAVVRGLSWVVLFDQDSTPSPGMTLSLLGRFRRLMEAGQRPSVVGPRPISPDGTAYKTPDTFGVSKVGQSDALLQTLFLISSGSLTHTQAYRDIGPFREDFFIDAIDIEWCMRAGRAATPAGWLWMCRCSTASASA